MRMVIPSITTTAKSRDTLSWGAFDFQEAPFCSDGETL
jgi:hypothetical protein